MLKTTEPSDEFEEEKKNKRKEISLPFVLFPEFHL